MRNIVVDAGPLIALFDGSDKYHKQAVRFVKNEAGVLHTNIPVITEVMYLLDFSTNAQKEFLGWVSSALTIDGNTSYDFNKISVLMEKYADLPADFGDDLLVSLRER